VLVILKTKKMLLSNISKGSGLPLVFLHGYLENKELWNEFSGYFIDKKVICIDLPGCGESPVQKEQSIESMAMAVYETLASLKIQKAFFIAHSMGGYVALSLAKIHPEIFNGLVLLHSHPFADSDEKRKARLQEIEIVKAGKKTLLLQQFIPKLYAPHFNDEQCFSLSRKMAENTTTEGMIACLQAMAHRVDASSLLHRAPFPILWIYGKYDQLFNFELAEKFETHNPLVTKYLLHHSGHMGMLEQPTETATIINSFLK